MKGNSHISVKYLYSFSSTCVQENSTRILEACEKCSKFSVWSWHHIYQVYISSWDFVPALCVSFYLTHHSYMYIEPVKKAIYMLLTLGKKNHFIHLFIKA